jgi:ABC-2 type transport system ATP-binding protein
MIEVHHLRKEYQGKAALENLHLEIPAGEVFGLIGPNGAGKTTLIRILATLLEPTYGEVRIGGIDVLAEPLRAHRLIGYMSDFFSLYDDMLVWEYLDHFGRCYGAARRLRPDFVEELLKLVALEVRRDALIRTLSRGMRQRLFFAKTLVHQPQVLLLDEPASGLDPAGRVEFRELIKQLHAMGHTIVISSHILTEMTDFCTSIGIIEKGRLVVSGRVADILQRLQPGLQLDIEVTAGLPQLMRLLEDHPAVEQVTASDGRVQCCWREQRAGLAELHRQIVTAGVDLVSFVVKGHNLEDIYMKLAKHETA